jgi:hypothetical protein
MVVSWFHPLTWMTEAPMTEFEDLVRSLVVERFSRTPRKIEGHPRPADRHATTEQTNGKGERPQASAATRTDRRRA